MVHPKIAGKRVHSKPLGVMDVMPTILDVAGIKHPAPLYKGRTVVNMLGSSLWPMLKGESDQTHPDNYVIARELFGKRALQQGDWSIVSLGKPWDDGDWRLYNLAEDISQRKNLSKENPRVLNDMEQLWKQYQLDVNVIMPEQPSPY
tara:strand:+ start:2215 stop:2655 length:441 start_codon:yes stop_codon:yes gene_type:complete